MSTAVADDRHVVRNAHDHPPIDPRGTVVAEAIGLVLDPAVHRNETRLLRAIDQPGRAEGPPAVGLLALIPVLDHLPEETVFVVDAVAEAGHAQGGEGIEEAGGETSETTVSEAGVRLGLSDLVDVDPELAERAMTELQDAERL